MTEPSERARTLAAKLDLRSTPILTKWRADLIQADGIDPAVAEAVAPLVEALRALRREADSKPYCPIGHIWEHGRAGQQARAALAPYQPREQSSEGE